jgi:ABC-type iron transport system FetAB ATPase subunit
MAACLEARSLTFSPHAALTRQVSFSVEAGQALRVDGPSGAGKTTLLRVLARLSAADAGELLLGGEPAEGLPVARWRREVALLAQRPVMLPGGVADNLGLAGAPRRFRAPLEIERAKQVLSELELDVGRLWSMDAQRLSGGEAARVALCRALLADPRVLLLDEPTASLDAESAAALIALCGRQLEQGRALLLVAHDSAAWHQALGERLQVLELHTLGAGSEQEKSE